MRIVVWFGRVTVGADQFLIAMPGMKDDRFARSVIYVSVAVGWLVYDRLMTYGKRTLPCHPDWRQRRFLHVPMSGHHLALH